MLDSDGFWVSRQILCDFSLYHALKDPFFELHAGAVEIAGGALASAAGGLGKHLRL